MKILRCNWKVMSSANSGTFDAHCFRDQLPILYHDKNFLVVNKFFDLKVNSDNSADLTTVATILRAMFPSLCDAKIAHGFRYDAFKCN